MHSVVIIFAKDPQLPPPYTSRFQNFSFTCTWDFCKNPRTYSEKSDMYNFLCFCKSYQFFTLSERLLWYLTYTYFRCPSQRGQSLSTFFSLKNFISNFVNVNNALSNFAKRKTSSSDIYPVATVYQSSDILRRPQNSGHLPLFLCHSLVA